MAVGEHINWRQPRGFKADHRLGYSDIERLMSAARTYFVPELADDQPLPALALLETLDEKAVIVGGRRVPFDWGVAELDRGVEGRTRYDEERDKIVIEVSPATYEALEANQPRALTTVAHEASHGILHTQQLIRISQIPHSQMALQRASGPMHRHFEDTEWQANAGAAALSMPAKGLALLERRYGTLTRELIQLTFKVSAEAAAYRLDCFQKRRSELL